MTVRFQQLINNSSVYFKMLKVYFLMTRCRCTHKLGGYCDCAMPTVDKQFKCILQNVQSIFTDDTMSVYT